MLECVNTEARCFVEPKAQLKGSAPARTAIAAAGSTAAQTLAFIHSRNGLHNRTTSGDLAPTLPSRDYAAADLRALTIRSNTKRELHRRVR